MIRSMRLSVFVDQTIELIKDLAVTLWNEKWSGESYQDLFDELDE